MSELIASALTRRVRDTTLIENASFKLSQGELVVLLGPNGSGKTSLIQTSLGLSAPTAGRAILDDHDTRYMSPIKRAKTLAYLPQMRPLAWPGYVYDVVALGRFAHGVTLGKLGSEDAAAVERALTDCDLTALARRQVHTLSGGELARMHCARAFVAQTPLLIADEPTAALDPRHQFRIMDLIAAYVRDGGGALVVLHDVQLAARYASRLIWMQRGCIVADGPPDETLDADRLRQIYGVDASVDGKLVTIDGVAG